jgi:hypothetical protein
VIAANQPPLAEAYLEHFGVKGMKWGQRKSGTSSKRSKALKIGGAAAVAAGAAVAVTVLARGGRLPIGRSTATRAAKGRAAAARISDQAVWKKNVNSVLSDMRSANADQDRWMRSLGLGEAVNKANLADVTAKLNDPKHVWDL